MGFMFVGSYWLVESIPNWERSGFSVISSEGKAKEPFTGVFFGVIFILYGLWELRNAAKNKNT